MSGEPRHPPAVLRTRGLTKYYGRTVGVEDLDLEIAGGELFGLLGPNGSGKTTTLRLILDLIRPTRGEALLFGLPPRRPAARARVGYLPGELALDPLMSGRGTLRFFERLDPRSAGADTARRRAELAERLGLTERDLRRRVREYSRGMKQKLALVAAFQHAPDLLVLDEPTTGLDPLVREVVFRMMEEARSRGASVLHSSHVLSEVERTCTRVGILRAGRMAALMTVDEMRRETRRRMVVHFRGPAPREHLELPGVEVAEVDGSRVVLLVTGEPGPLLTVLARLDVTHLAYPEASLEEAFASHYRADLSGEATP